MANLTKEAEERARDEVTAAELYQHHPIVRFIVDGFVKGSTFRAIMASLRQLVNFVKGGNEPDLAKKFPNFAGLTPVEKDTCACTALYYFFATLNPKDMSVFVNTCRDCDECKKSSGPPAKDHKCKTIPFGTLLNDRDEAITQVCGVNMDAPLPEVAYNIFQARLLINKDTKVAKYRLLHYWPGTQNIFTHQKKAFNANDSYNNILLAHLKGVECAPAEEGSSSREFWKAVLKTHGFDVPETAAAAAPSEVVNSQPDFTPSGEDDVFGSTGDAAPVAVESTTYMATQPNGHLHSQSYQTPLPYAPQSPSKRPCNGTDYTAANGFALLQTPEQQQRQQYQQTYVPQQQHTELESPFHEGGAYELLSHICEMAKEGFTNIPSRNLPDMLKELNACLIQLCINMCDLHTSFLPQGSLASSVLQWKAACNILRDFIVFLCTHKTYTQEMFEQTQQKVFNAIETLFEPENMDMFFVQEEVLQVVRPEYTFINPISGKTTVVPAVTQKNVTMVSSRKAFF